jgi:hypothetical protein
MTKAQEELLLRIGQAVAAMLPRDSDTLCAMVDTNARQAYEIWEDLNKAYDAAKKEFDQKYPKG